MKTHSKRILIIEDDNDISEIVKHMLENDGFNVCTHNSGLEVPEAVHYYQPHLILLDIQLPGKSGTEVCKEIKQLHSIPVILFSAYTLQQNVYNNSEADAFIQKPFEIKDLLGTIKSFLN